ncbi:MAG: hypothetical protein ACRERE_29680 [Candidatus Entotheonellia bacterium]
MDERILVEHPMSVSYHGEPLLTCAEILGVLVIAKRDPRAVISVLSAVIG